MTEKRFKYGMENDKWVLVDYLEDAYYYFGTTENTMIALTNLLNSLNKENEQLKDEINKLNHLLNLIARAYSFTKEESVKEILRNEIKGIDTVTEENAQAWNDYCILSKFFKKQYGEEWDND